MNQSLLFRTVVGFCLFVQLACAHLASAEEEQASPNLQTEVITLNYVLPQDILPTLTPFLAKGGQIKPINNQLIIQSTPDNITALKSIIEQIDIAPKKLMITVSNGHDKPSEIESISPNGDVTFGQDTSGYHTLSISTNSESQRQVSTIRVDNGQVAFIQTGVTIPLITEQFGGQSNFQSQSSLKGQRSGTRTTTGSTPGTATGTSSIGTTASATATGSRTTSGTGTTTSFGTTAGATTSASASAATTGANTTAATGTSSLTGSGSASGNSSGGGQSVDYQNLSNGFYAKPQLIGKEVKLDLSTQNDQPIATNAGSTIQPAYTTFNAQTTVMIPVGKWTYFGGNQAQDQVSNGTSYRTGSRDQGQKSLWLRVDVIPD